MREMDALNCQFYETGVTKVSCYRYRRRRCAVYRRRALITKSPRGDKVIIEREKKKESKARRLLAKPYVGIGAIRTSQYADSANARKRSSFATMEGRGLFVVRFIFSRRKSNPQKLH